MSCIYCTMYSRIDLNFIPPTGQTQNSEYWAFRPVRCSSIDCPFAEHDNPINLFFFDKLAAFLLYEAFHTSLINFIYIIDLTLIHVSQMCLVYHLPSNQSLLHGDPHSLWRAVRSLCGAPFTICLINMHRGRYLWSIQKCWMQYKCNGVSTSCVHSVHVLTVLDLCARLPYRSENRTAKLMHHTNDKRICILIKKNRMFCVRIRTRLDSCFTHFIYCKMVHLVCDMKCRQRPALSVRRCRCGARVCTRVGVSLCECQIYSLSYLHSRWVCSHEFFF